MFLRAAEIQRDDCGAPVFRPGKSNFGERVWVNCSGQTSPRPTLSRGVHQQEVVHTPV